MKPLEACPHDPPHYTPSACLCASAEEMMAQPPRTRWERLRDRVLERVALWPSIRRQVAAMERDPAHYWKREARFFRDIAIAGWALLLILLWSNW